MSPVSGFKWPVSGTGPASPGTGAAVPLSSLFPDTRRRTPENRGETSALARRIIGVR
jgi:hypothetical protein